MPPLLLLSSGVDHAAIFPSLHCSFSSSALTNLRVLFVVHSCLRPVFRSYLMRLDRLAALLAKLLHFVHTCILSQRRQTWIEPRPIRTRYVGRASPSSNGCSRSRHPFPRYTSNNCVDEASVKGCQKPYSTTVRKMWEPRRALGSLP
jgi:hypothetical protein